MSEKSELQKELDEFYASVKAGDCFCRATDKCFSCTKLSGHEGDHEARWVGRLWHAWTRKPATVQYTTTRRWRPEIGPGKSFEEAIEEALADGTLVEVKQ